MTTPEPPGARGAATSGTPAPFEQRRREGGIASTPSVSAPHRPSEAHPLSAQCVARNKKTGERCKQRVIGGGPCRFHGGAAPQVAAARQARILAGEAALAAQGDPRRDPADALQAAAQDADVIVQRLKRQVRAGDVIDIPSLQVLGDWLDRVSRLSKGVLDARIDERRVELEQVRANMVISSFHASLEDLGLSEVERDGVARRFVAGLTIAKSETVAGELES